MISLCSHGKTKDCLDCKGLPDRCPRHPWEIRTFGYCGMCDALIIARIVNGSVTTTG